MDADWQLMQTQDEILKFERTKLVSTLYDGTAGLQRLLPEGLSQRI
jgi:hypothetical protein